MKQHEIEAQKAALRAERWDRFNEIAESLKKLGFTQSDISRATGISQPRISQIINGSTPTNEHLGMIIALGIREGVIDCE